MASVFVRKMKDRDYLAIYGAKCVRINSKAITTTQVYLGKILIPSGDVIFNDKLDNWLNLHNLDMNYVYQKILDEAKKNQINVTFVTKNEYQVNDQISKKNTNANNSADNITCHLNYQDLENSDHLNFGHIYLLKNLSDSLGLTKILQEVFPTKWNQILILAKFSAIKCAPSMYCHDWVQNTELDVNEQPFTSQRISDLFAELPQSSIYDFYEKWANFLKEQNYIALDNTSISTYSEEIEEAEYGYNRDGDNLKQINVSLLFGENSGLPVYLTLYHGSINDVKTLQSTLEQFKLLNNQRANYSLTLDKSFFSRDNMDYMTENKPTIKFNISLPKTNHLFEELLSEAIAKMHPTDSVIITSSGILFGISKRIKWYNGKQIYAHIYLDRHRKIRDEDIIIINVFDMLKQATSNPEKFKDKKEYNKILSFRNSVKSPTGYIVRIKQNIFEKKSYKSGWIILLSNNISDIQQAIQQYRKKDVVEKAFNLLKNHNVLDRVRVHSYKNFTSKSFVCFISLILLSKVHDVMDEHNLYSSYTMEKLFDYLGSLKVLHIKGEKILQPLTAEHKQLFKFFDCPLPTIANSFASQEFI